MTKELTASARPKRGPNAALQVAVVIPNWNGSASIRQCLDSVFAQTLKPHVIVVDNGSADDSAAIVIREYPGVELIQHDENKGYAGGVNPGFRLALERGFDYVAPFNNDAVADKQWLQMLVESLETRPAYGIATCKLLGADGEHLDSTGDYYTSWGLPYPRGRNEADIDKYDGLREIFGASGGASLYRVSMLDEIGLLDEDFFAYYEDVDLSFRAQWAGWKVTYVPSSVVFHATSSTGKRLKGTGRQQKTPSATTGHEAPNSPEDRTASQPINSFFTYQTMKNLPMLLWKNVPTNLLPAVLPRFTLVYLSFFAAAIQRRQFGFALRGAGRSLLLLPKKLRERRHIMHTAKVDNDYIASIITYDLPPNARRLRALRKTFRRQGLAGDRSDNASKAGE